MVPVGDAGHDLPLEVGENLGHRRWLAGRDVRKLPAEVARLDPRQDRISPNFFEVVGDPIGNPMDVIAEYDGIHIAEAILAEV
jgi:hypothetical protein